MEEVVAILGSRPTFTAKGTGSSEVLNLVDWNGSEGAIWISVDKCPNFFLVRKDPIDWNGATPENGGFLESNDVSLATRIQRWLALQPRMEILRD